MKRFARVALLLALISLLAVDGSERASVESESNGHASASGRGFATSSTRGRGGGSHVTVTTTTTASSSGGGDATTHKTYSSTGGGTTRKQDVTVEEGKVSSTSEVRGTGSVSASSSAVVTPGTSRGRSSTTAGGKTKTITKEKEWGEKPRTKKTTTTEGESSKGTKGKASKAKLGKFADLPLCDGLAKFDCCDDRTFLTIEGRTYCGCWGLEKKRSLCSFERVNEDPLVVQDIFADFAVGDSCRCPELSEERIDQCIGMTKTDCCDEYEGGEKCQCLFPDTCLYERVSNDPLIWKHTKARGVKCRC